MDHVIHASYVLLDLRRERCLWNLAFSEYGERIVE